METRSNLPSYRGVVPTGDYPERIFMLNRAGLGDVEEIIATSSSYSVPRNGPPPLVEKVHMNKRCVIPVHLYPRTAVTLFALDGGCAVAFLPSNPIEELCLSKMIGQVILYIPAGQAHCVYTSATTGVSFLALYESVRSGSQPEIVWEELQ